MVSYIRGNDNFDSTYTNGMVGSPKAWVAFNGQGTLSITASGNTSSVTDLGVGRYQMNIASALTDGNYAEAFSGHESWTNVNTSGTWAAEGARITSTSTLCVASFGGGSGDAIKFTFTLVR